MAEVDVTLIVEGTELQVTGDLDVVGSNDNVTVDLVAGQTLSGHRVVTTNADGVAVYAEPTAPPHGPLMVATNAADVGEPVAAVAYGVVDEPSWDWPVDVKLFLTPGGYLSPTPPTSGVAIRVAWSMTPTRIFVHQGAPITLSPPA